MKIAITGGTGFIGRWFLRLYGEKHECVVLGRDGDRCEVDVDSTAYPYIGQDYSQSVLVELLKGCDAVVHMAAKRHARDAGFADYVENETITANLVAACADAGVSTLVHLSSIAVYGAAPRPPWSEAVVPQPRTHYGISKLASEHLANRGASHGLAVRNLRVAQVLGLGERPGFMLSTFWKRAQAKERLMLWGRGVGARQYIHVKDLCAAINCALGAGEAPETMNIGNPATTSHRELAELVNRVWNNAGNLAFDATRSEDTSVQCMDTSLARTRLGWTARWTVEKALADMRRDDEKGLDP